MTELVEKKIEEYINLIDYDNTASILAFGTKTQEQIADLSKLIVTELGDTSDEDIFDGIKIKKGNLDKLEAALDEYRIKLLMENALLSRMKKMNDEYLTDLDCLIQAAKKKLESFRADKKDTMARRSITYIAGFITKKIESLELSKEVANQQRAQLELLMASVVVMAESIQNIIFTTIPSYKSNVISEKILSDEFREIVKGNKEKSNKTAGIRKLLEG